MEPTPLLLFLSLGWTCSGLLTVLPQEPLVEIGGSIQLNCSLDCPDGKVQWKGLDTNLGNIISTPSYSLLLVTNAATTMEGIHICVGYCQGKSFQEHVNLQVYSLPDTLQLESQAKELVAGQPAHLHCSVSKVYPPGSLTLSWYRGDQRLESTPPEEVGDYEELFRYDSELGVPAEQVTEGTEFRCEVELLLSPQRSFQQEGAVTVSKKAVSEAPTTESVTSQETPRTETPATTENPSAPDRRPTTGLMTTSRNPPMGLTSTAKPTTEFTGTSHKPNTKATSVHWQVSTETLTIESSTATTDRNPSSDLSSASENLTPENGARTESSLSKIDTSGPNPSTESVCNLLIRPVPPKGTIGEALKIICEAECSEDVTISWVKTPVALSQYQEEASESKSTLTVDRVNLSYQGIYQCVMLSRRPQMASLHITVSAATFSTDSAIAVGTAGSLLGLIVTAFASRRLWRRLHPLGGKSPKGDGV
ncbi:mucosal addressin cell adhesion molecule 1 [Emydura macquarii macquarii]|uniref:mucosal addressin cell adhesion molecule 1 n=1 Tax=Emydura macquarii macquarii TaxID=1129001 RepID=UPI00352A6294